MKTNIKTLMFALVAVFSLVAVAGLGGATTIFDDGFESGNLNSWTVTSDPGANAWVASQTNPKTDSWHAQAMPGSGGSSLTTTMLKAQSTLGYNNIVLSYERRLGGVNGFEIGDEFKLLWSSDGTNFEALEETLDNTPNDANYVPKQFNLPSNANNNTNLKIKFECTTSVADEFCRVDDVKIEGTQISQESSLSLTKLQDLTKTQDGKVRVTNNGSVTITGITLSSTGDFPVTFTPSAPFDLTSGATKDITVTGDLTNLKFGNNIVTITAKGKYNSIDVTSNAISFTIANGFCKSGEQGGNLSIRNIDFNNLGEGDDSEWRLVDIVEIEVEVENEGNDDIDDVFIELGLFDDNGKNQINELDFENEDDEEIDAGRIRDGDKETVTFVFKVPADIDIGNYKLAVKVYSDDVGEENECADTSSDLSEDLYQKVEIIDESDEGRFIFIDNIEITPSPATCGEKVKLTADVYNIGDDEQDRVKVILKNTALGIDEELEITSKMELGDKEEISFEFNIPAGAENKLYSFLLSTRYDYRNGNYRQASEEDADIQLDLIGCGEVPGPEKIADIDVNLDSEAFPGEQMTVSAVITNLQSSKASFIIDVLDYSSWATLDDISERLIDLDAGESKEVTLKFSVDKEASGEKTFILKIMSDTGEETREVAVNIQQPAGVGGFDLGNNSLLWIIGIINVILIILIIIVAVKVSRR